MKVVAITGKRECAVVNRPDPAPGGDLVVVKILVAPMCTEVHGYREGWASDSLGHEAAGEVVATDGNRKVKAGDRVVVMPQYPCGKCALCRAGNYIHCEQNRDPLKECGCQAGTATYAQYVLKQDWLCLKVPKGMTIEHASMACCGLGPTFGAMQMMEVGPKDTVFITGMGAVGLGGVVNARHRGARVIAAEGHPWRAALARKLGACAVVDPAGKDAGAKVRKLTGGLGADMSVETSGRPEAKALLLDGTRRKGQVALVGWGGQLEVNTILSKGLTVRGAWHWNLKDASALMKTIRESGPALKRLITHTFPMTRVKEAWELQLTGECGKILLYPWK